MEEVVVGQSSHCHLCDGTATRLHMYVEEVDASAESPTGWRVTTANQKPTTRKADTQPTADESWLHTETWPAKLLGSCSLGLETHGALPLGCARRGSGGHFRAACSGR